MNKEERYKHLCKQVVAWAKERDLINPKNTDKQYLKFLEEVGETARAILKNDKPQIIDGFGDIAITMIILGEQLNHKYALSCTHTIIEIELYDVVRRMSPEYANPSAMNFLHDAAAKYGLDLIDCLESAYNEIKDRKGKTFDGSFHKEQ